MVTTKRRTKFIEAIAPLPKTQSELKQRVRSLAHSDARLAVEWLNAAKGTVAYRRVLAAREELTALGDALNSLREQKRVLKGRRPRTEQQLADDARDSLQAAASHEEFRKRHNALNRLLYRYAHVPVLAYNVDDGVWRFGMIPKAARGPEIQIADGPIAVRVNESSVVAALSRLAVSRELYKVRLCETCGEQWRVSERKIDRFCSQKCREAFYAKSPDYKERKAANQRDYRERLKSGKRNGAYGF